MLKKAMQCGLFCSYALAIAGCVEVGPRSIIASRTYYNEVLASTSNEQLLLNIARVSQQEIPVFLDIPEVDATHSMQGNAQGGVGSIGALTGFLGSASGSITYTESPIIKYIPLSGNALIEQIGTPITGRSIVRLINSDWPTASVLEFVIDNITPEFLQNYPVLDAITALDAFGVLTFEADPKEDDVFYMRFNAEGALSPKIAQAVTRDRDALKCLQSPNNRATILRLWSVVQAGLKQSGNTITVHTNVRGKSGYAIKTHSALGALKQAEFNDFAIVPSDVAASMRFANSKSHCWTRNFYYQTDDRQQNSLEDVNQLWNVTADILLGKASRSEAQVASYHNGHKRAFLIIERSKEKPVESYVSVFHRGNWYSINIDDKITNLNFAFLNHLLTIQAIVDVTKLTPTVISANR